MSAPAAAPPEPPPETPAPPTADGSRFFSNDAVAKLLNIQPQSLRLMRMRGSSPPYVRLAGPSSMARYPESDLFEWIRSRPRYVSTASEKAAVHAAAKASAPPKTRQRLVRRQVPFADPLVDSTRKPTRPSRSGAKSRRKK